MSIKTRPSLKFSPEKMILLDALRQKEGLTAVSNGRIPRQPRHEPLPLSFMQERLWFFSQMQPASPAYNMTVAFWLAGELNTAVLQQALTTLAARHEILRTAFPAENGRPAQIIQETPTIQLARYRATKAEAIVLAHQLSQTPFDLSQAPLWRAVLIGVDATNHLLVLVMHHIITDGWSLGILWQELATLYTINNQPVPTGSSIALRPSSLAPLPIQYADYAHWQREKAQGAVLSEWLTYWKKQLADSPPLLNLATDRPRPSVASYRGAAESLNLPPELTQALKHLSQAEGATLFMTLLAAFKVLLYRYSGQEDLLIGTPVAGRHRLELENMVGPILNTLVLRTDLSGTPSFRALLGRVRQIALNAYAHQDLPFEKLVETLLPARDLSYTPLFQVMFALQNVPAEGQLHLPGLQVTAVPVEGNSAKFDLSLTLIDTPQGITGGLAYSTDLFDRETIIRLLSHFSNLLTAIVANPDQPISHLPMLSEAERHQLLVTWNDTAVPIPNTTFPALFEAQVAQTPQATAVIWGEMCLTYEQLNGRANQLAHYLQAQGIGPEKLVGICLKRSPDMLIAVLATLKAGGAYVPIDSDTPPERLAFLVEDCQPIVVITQQEIYDLQFTIDDSPVPIVNHQSEMINLDTAWPLIAHYPSTNPVSAVPPHHLAYVLYTSGSTGQPKGVMVTHRNLLNYLLWVQNTLFGDAVSYVAATTKLTFDACLKQLLAPLLQGQAVWLIPEELILQPIELWQILNSRSRVALNCVPSLWQTILETAVSPSANPGVTHLLVGGEAFSPELVQRTLAVLPHLKLWNLYGPTEATANACATPIQPGGKVPIGRPIANTQIYILDPHLNPVPVGVPGELYIGGAGVAQGYLNRPELTAEKFTICDLRLTIDDAPNRQSTILNHKLYRSGDLVRYLPTGEIEFLGRVDHQVKIRGFRIELDEIAATLNQHSAVRDSLVVVWQPEPEQKHLVAYAIAKSEPPPSTHELREFLQQKLPGYMIPAFFVWLPAWPLLSSGKVNRHALPAPAVDPSALAVTHVNPRDGLELHLVQIWQEVLKVKGIGVRDNFFDLGGHSLLAVHLMARIEKELGYKRPLSLLFQKGTVEELATTLRQENTADSASPLVPIQPAGSQPPLFLVHPAGGTVLCYVDLARRLGRDQPVYGLEAPGLQGDHLFDRLPELAAHYLTAVQTIQPQGPYHLGGWCVGGTIAFEMAQQLHQQGETVALLAFIDSYAPPIVSEADTPVNDELGVDEATLYTLFMVGLSGHYGKKLQVEPEELQNLSAEERPKQVLARLQGAGIMPPDATVAYMQRYLNVYLSNGRALNHYAPQVYPGEAILFRATHEPRHQYFDATLGWGPLIGGRLTIQDSPGSHSTMIFEPQAAALAEAISQVIVQK